MPCRHRYACASPDRPVGCRVGGDGALRRADLNRPALRPPWLLAALVLAALSAGTAPVRVQAQAPGQADARSRDRAAGDVTIYRCTGGDGRVSIGNVPCADGAREETRSMVRPQDAPPSPSSPPASGPAAGAPPSPPSVVVQQVVVPAPQPLYECMRPDGSVYESDSGEGELRWRPLWSTGWPVGGWRSSGHGGRPPGRGDLGARGATNRAGDGLSAPPVSRISIPPDPPRPDPRGGSRPRPRPPHGGWGIAEPGVRERDPCHVLPQAETCSRLRDRRQDIRRRIFNAQQRERDALRVEERGLTARLARDCGAS